MYPLAIHIGPLAPYIRFKSSFKNRRPVKIAFVICYSIVPVRITSISYSGRSTSGALSTDEFMSKVRPVP